MVLDPIQVAWAAGILEGEGCFSLRKHNGTLQVSLTMTDLDVVERVTQIFPGVAAINSYQAPGNRKVAFTATWNGQHAYRLMQSVLPFTGVRRTEKILQNISDWLERRMRVCQECGVEFVVREKNTFRYCDPSCTETAHARQKLASRARMAGRKVA